MVLDVACPVHDQLGPRYMIRNVALSRRNIHDGKYHTLLTSAFAHAELGHLGLNMMTLYFFGGPLAGLLGPSRFMRLYLGGALVSSVCVLLYHTIIPKLRVPASWITPYDTPT